MQDADKASLRCHVLANLAYAHLATHGTIEALRFAEELLTSPDCPGHLRFLGHLYAAEAHIHSGRVAQAIVHLAPENVGDLSATPASALAAAAVSGGSGSGGCGRGGGDEWQRRR